MKRSVKTHEFNIIEFTSQVMILILPGWDTSSLRSFIHFIHALRILFACNKVHWILFVFSPGIHHSDPIVREENATIHWILALVQRGLIHVAFPGLLVMVGFA